MISATQADPVQDKLNLADSSTCPCNQATSSDHTKSWPASARAGWARCTRLATLGSNGSSQSNNDKEVHKARFEQEARVIAALNHPHICRSSTSVPTIW
jgi:hypothetical protein